MFLNYSGLAVINRCEDASEANLVLKNDVLDLIEGSCRRDLVLTKCSGFRRESLSAFSYGYIKRYSSKFYYFVSSGRFMG